MYEEEEDDRMFLEKHGGKLGFLVVLVVGGVVAFWFMNRKPEKPRPKPVGPKPTSTRTAVPRSRATMKRFGA